MSKIVIYGSTVPDDLVRLKLEAYDEGVRVIAVDKFGSRIGCGNLLHISEKGVYLYGGINETLNFPRDTNGRLIQRRS